MGSNRLKNTARTSRSSTKVFGKKVEDEEELGDAKGEMPMR